MHNMYNANDRLHFHHLAMTFQFFLYLFHLRRIYFDQYFLPPYAQANSYSMWFFELIAFNCNNRPAFCFKGCRSVGIEKKLCFQFLNHAQYVGNTWLPLFSSFHWSSNFFLVWNKWSIHQNNFDRYFLLPEFQSNSYFLMFMYWSHLKEIIDAYFVSRDHVWVEYEKKKHCIFFIFTTQGLFFYTSSIFIEFTPINIFWHLNSRVIHISRCFSHELNWKLAIDLHFVFIKLSTSFSSLCTHVPIFSNAM